MRNFLRWDSATIASVAALALVSFYPPPRYYLHSPIIGDFGQPGPA
jgi:hypothetical protein